MIAARVGDPLLTADEACLVLDVKRRTLRNKLTRHELVADGRNGVRPLFRRSQLERYLESRAERYRVARAGGRS